MTEAIKFCFERPAPFVVQYVADIFELDPPEPTPPKQKERRDPGEHADVPEPQVAAASSPGLEADPAVSSGLEAGEGGEDTDSIAPAAGSPEQAEDGPLTPESAQTTSTRAVRPRPSTQTVPLIERFARANGFRKQDPNRHRHPDGSWIGRAAGGRFPWELRAATGGLVRYYWPAECCLKRESLEVPADVWHLISGHPNTYSFVLLDEAGVPIEVTGTQLVSLKEQGRITVSLAVYRLAYEHDV